MRKANMDVISLPIELADNKFDSKFRLVIAVIKRAKALRQGAMPTITTRAEKITTMAIEEVLSGSLCILTGAAAVKAEDEAGKRIREIVMDEAGHKEAFPEEQTDIEKELERYLRKKETAKQTL